MMNRTWKTLDGAEVKDIIGEIKKITSETTREVHIGSDSQQNGKFTEYVTVVVLLEKGKGGRVFYSKEKTPRITSLRERLLKEVWMSVNAGLELNAMVPETVGLTVHVDANPDVKFRSSDYVKEMVSMVVSQGFKVEMKPDSWCASHAADHVVKHKVMGL